MFRNCNRPAVFGNLTVSRRRLALFEKAVRKYPQNLVALVDASRALGARFEINKAEAMLDRLAKLGAHNPQLMHLAGQSFRMIFRPEKAIQCFERVVAMTRQIPDAQLELAVLYERRHRVAEALFSDRRVPSCGTRLPGSRVVQGPAAPPAERPRGRRSHFPQTGPRATTLCPWSAPKPGPRSPNSATATGDYDGAMAAMLGVQGLPDTE